MSKDFKLPDLGEGVHEGQIVRVMVSAGDHVREDQPLLEVETDKAAVVIPSPFVGVVETVHVRDGQMVHVGDVMVSFGDSIQKPGPATPVARNSKGNATSATFIAAPAKPPAAHRKPASPAVRKLARELGVNLDSIRGSGPGGRIERSDVERAANNSPLPLGEGSGVRARMDYNNLSAPPSSQPFRHGGSATPRGRGSGAVAARVAYPAVPESLVVEPEGETASDSYGPIKRASLTQARKTIAQVMAQSWSSIPHATDFDDADVSELDKIRQGYASPDQTQRKLTLLAFVVRAVVRALQRFPEFNAGIDIDKNEIIYKRYFNIAIGVHTERGLIPMVLRNTDQMSIPQISDALAEIGEKARTASFAVNDTRGGTYTISNAGAMGGSRYSTPLITPPQVAVLAIGRTRWRPWVVESDAHRGIAPRLVMPLSHSIDHRLLDGGQEVQFMQQIIGDLQNPARLLL